MEFNEISTTAGEDEISSTFLPKLSSDPYVVKSCNPNPSSHGKLYWFRFARSILLKSNNPGSWKFTHQQGSKVKLLYYHLRSYRQNYPCCLLLRSWPSSSNKWLRLAFLTFSSHASHVFCMRTYEGASWWMSEFAHELSRSIWGRHILLRGLEDERDWA